MKNKHFGIIVLILLSTFLLASLYLNYHLINKLEQNSHKMNALTKKIDSYQQSLLQNKDLNNNLKLKKLRLVLENYLAKKPKQKKYKGENLSNAQNFYPDILPVNNPYRVSKKYSEKHQALDFAGKKGSPVLATAAGVVEHTNEDTYFGKTITINHLNGFKTIYAHLDSILVSQNTFVSKNHEIAKLGDSGYSTNPHLHYEIHHNEKKQNPEDFIKDI